MTNRQQGDQSRNPAAQQQQGCGQPATVDHEHLRHGNEGPVPPEPERQRPGPNASR